MTLDNEDRLAIIHVHLEKAEEAYESAVFLSESRRDYNGAANRAYYAMFHAEKALLHTRGISGDSHKHVHMQLSNQFVKEGKLPNYTGSNIKYVETIRRIADYSEQKSVTEEEVKKALIEIKNFMESAKKILHDFEKELPNQ